MHRYHCLIPDIRGECILAVPLAEGRWTLPSFQQDGEWFAYTSIAIAKSATEYFGIAMTALHERSIPDARVCELEIQARQWAPPAGARWIASHEVDATPLEPAALSNVLRAWFSEKDGGAIPALRPPWERRGWYAGALTWIEAECTRLGCAPCGPAEQIKAAWSLSTILRVNTSAGALYFKADYARPPSEPRIIEALARRWPRNVPDVLAVDYDRSWMLMRDFGERSLDGEPLATWQAASRTFSSIQRACSDDLEPWWRLECPDLRIPALIAQMDRLLDDDKALKLGEPGGLTITEASRLRELRPRLHETWNQLAAIPLPDSIVQQDFRHHNLVMSESAFIFYDWSDTVISHPFFSCRRFLDFVHHDAHPHAGLSLAERCSGIGEAYLEPWTDILDQSELRRAFHLAGHLNPVYIAVRCYLEAPYCEPGSHWHRTMLERPAVELRRFLADTDYMDRSSA
jgi:hypothetical protein